MQLGDARDSNLVHGMEEAASTNPSTPFCHRMTHNIAQDAFFNKCHRRKKNASRQVSPPQEVRQPNCTKGPVERDHTSFPELDHLVRMNYQIRITWFVVRGSKL